MLLQLLFENFFCFADHPPNSDTLLQDLEIKPSHEEEKPLLQNVRLAKRFGCIGKDLSSVRPITFSVPHECASLQDILNENRFEQVICIKDTTKIMYF